MNKDSIDAYVPHAITPCEYPNFAGNVVKNGGDLIPLLIDSKETGGTGVTNGSVALINDKLHVNLRHVEYTLYHAEKVKYAHPWGPVVYLHPENDWRLITNNFLGVINDDFTDWEYYSKVNMKLDVTPIWEFVGLEDARVVQWDDKIFLTGVRRDTTKNGIGRMELSEVQLDENGKWEEVSRQRIPIPKETLETINTGPSYCEKNWMPVIDQPYTWVKWCNPVEVVRYDPTTKETKTISLDESKYVNLDFDFRGGSQVIPYKDDYYIALCHVTNLFKSESGRKNCTYRHRFIVFDKQWNIVKYTGELNFLESHVEFSCGMCFHEGNFVIVFGTQDNTSFVLKVPQKYLEDFIGV